MVLISAQAGMQNVADISKFFAGSSRSGKDAARVMSVAAFPIPIAYTEKASKDLSNGAKPPKMCGGERGRGQSPLVLRVAIV